MILDYYVIFFLTTCITLIIRHQSHYLHTNSLFVQVFSSISNSHTCAHLLCRPTTGLSLLGLSISLTYILSSQTPLFLYFTMAKSPQKNYSFSPIPQHRTL